jgi:hypothetical protein
MDQTKNIKAYAAYLEEKLAVYRELKVDYLRMETDQVERMRTLKWQDGLPQELTTMQRQIKVLLDCRFYLDSINNEITTEALRLLVKDLMRLFQLVNEGVINILRTLSRSYRVSYMCAEIFFELQKTDAVRALGIYKSFCEQATAVIEYFEFARKIQYGLGMTIPELKHVFN